MICPSCSNSVLSPAIAAKPLVLSYRGFNKEIASQLLLECSYCSYEHTEPLKGIDIDEQWAVFKREINSRLSGGELI